MALERKATSKNAVNKTEISQEDMLFIKTTLTKLNDAIIGDEKYGQRGLVQLVNEHNDYIEEDKKYKSRIVGGAIVVGAVWTFLLKFWDEIFQHAK